MTNTRKKSCLKRLRVLNPVFPSVQSVRLWPRAGRTPSLRPLPGTDAELWSVLIYARDGRPGPTGSYNFQ